MAITAKPAKFIHACIMQRVVDEAEYINCACRSTSSTRAIASSIRFRASGSYNSRFTATSSLMRCKTVSTVRSKTSGPHASAQHTATELRECGWKHGDSGYSAGEKLFSVTKNKNSL
jgi:hypothetical protein